MQALRQRFSKGSYMNQTFKIIISVFVFVGLSACGEESPQARELRAAALAVDMCKDSLAKETDAGARSIIEGSCKILQDRYDEKRRR
jgi:hypothetical protein